MKTSSSLCAADKMKGKNSMRRSLPAFVLVFMAPRRRGVPHEGAMKETEETLSVSNF